MFSIGTATFYKNRRKKWVAQHRWVAAQKGDARGISGDLNEGERVFHIDGNKENNEASNLIRIQYSTEKYRLKPLSSSRVLYRPKTVSELKKALAGF